MKIPLIICIIVLAGGLGYLLEPRFRSALADSSGIAPQEDPTGADEVLMLEELPIDISAYAPEQLPAVVKLKQPAQFKDKASGLTVAMPLGSTAKLISVDGKTAVVSPGETSYKILIAISKTDLLDQLATITPQAPSVASETTPTPEWDPSAETTATTTPEPAPIEATPTEPATTVTPTEPATTATTATPEPTPYVEPNTAPAPAPTISPGSSSKVVTVMKNSIQSAEIKEFNLNQVTEWKSDATETVDGHSFQTGIATYQYESTSGKKTIQAKAYIKNSKVVCWIWPTTGIQLK